jgi:hypothetical protein
VEKVMSWAPVIVGIFVGLQRPTESNPSASTNVEVIIMHLVEVFLPLNTNDGTPQPIELFRPVREQLADQFGGVTAFTRNPAKGISLLEDNERAEDDIIVYEVIVEAVDRHWWQSYKRDLEERFQQEEILIRVTAVSLVR